MFKKTLIALLILVLGSLVIGDVKAQTSTTYNTYAFGGITRSADSSTYSLRGGIGTRLGGNLWSFSSAQIGNATAIQEDVAYLIKPLKKVWLGPFVGTSGEAPSNIPKAVWYWIAATGGVAGYNFTDAVGINAWFKYKTTFDASNNFPQHWDVGANFHIGVNL